MIGNIVLECQIKTHDSWVGRIEILWEKSPEQAKTIKSTAQPPRKHINVLHAELNHPLEVIKHATGRAMGLILMAMFKPCKDCRLVKARKRSISKKNFKQSSKNLGEKLFFNISLPFTPTLRGKKHWLLVIEHNADYAWSFFLKEKSELKYVILGLVKDMNTKYGV